MSINNYNDFYKIENFPDDCFTYSHNKLL